MPLFHVTLIVDRNLSESALPQAPLRTRQRPDGGWAVELLAEDESFDRAAGRLWGEAVACGVSVIGVEPEHLPV